MHKIIKRLPEKIVLYDKEGSRISAIGWSNWDIIVTMEASDGSKIMFEEVPLGSFYNHAPWFIRDMPKDLLEDLWENRPQDTAIADPDTVEEPDK